MKTSLIMEGGGMRGMFTCGVNDVLLENDITFDGSAGISAGACFGCNFKSKQIGRALRYNLKYGKDPHYGSLRSLIRTGDYYNADFCYRQIPNELDVFDVETFAANPMEFYVGATDVETGRIIYHNFKDGGSTDIEWMRASASMPLVSKIVEIGRYKLLDGGIVDPVPFRFMERKGFDRNVIILTQPKGYEKKKSSIMPLFFTLMRDYPKIVQAMNVRHIRYNRQMEEIAEREEKNEVLVIRPPEELKIGRTEGNPKELQRVYDIGRAEAEKRLEEIRAFLRPDKDQADGKEEGE